MKRIHPEYKKIVKKYRRSLVKQAKNAVPYDFGALDMFVEFLRFMKEYYATGDNVVGLESEDPAHNRLTTLTYALAQYDEIAASENRHVERSIRYNEEKATGLLLAAAREIYKKATEDYLQEKEAAWNNFWNTVRDEFPYWWD